MVPVVSIVGRSGSGKTTLIVKIISGLKRRGYRVGVIKHDAHGFEIDHEGKDSWRHKKAGAATVALSSPAKFAVIKDVDKEWAPERIISAHLSDVDVVVAEGFKNAPFPKIEVVRKENSKKPVCAKDKELRAFVTDAEFASKVPVFGLNEHARITSFIDREIIKKHSPQEISLVVDGRYVPLKPFIENLIKDGVKGMIRSLKGCSDTTEIEIRIRPKDR
ncbi:MAG: molybdopterin-guanine dinucleotide biosynthesis protein B [Thermodesulfobacteriota bacterium]